MQEFAGVRSRSCLPRGPSSFVLGWHGIRNVLVAWGGPTMSEDSGSGSAKERPTSIPARRACFDAAFFSGFLGNRARALCTEHPDQTAVVLLHLADGAVLDLCHIEQLFADWLAGMVYRDPKTCDRMELVFVPYTLITRVTISLPSVHERQIGFQTKTPAPMSVLDGRD